MKKLLKLSAFVLFTFIIKTTSAQNNYINHTLKAGETLSALAKQYNTNVGDIMRVNGMHADTKLVYGSTIKIPSAKTNKINAQQSQSAKQDIVAAPANAITHTIAKGETLYSISKQYNVSVEQIKAWNNLTDNSAKLGSNLIVGQKNNSSAKLNKPITDVKLDRVETTQNLQENNVQPTQKNEVANNVAEEKKAVVTTSVQTVNEQPVTSADNTVTQISDKSQTDAGYFISQFNDKSKRNKHVSGISKTFKTASGWSDGKYYILADNINPGTIVKLNADNGKTVYAKVLWNMSDLKENSDVDFRVSDATAAALNENTPSFNVDIYY